MWRIINLYNLKKVRIYALLLLIMTVFAACKKSYLPNVVSSDNSYLVVEGIINSGGDTTVIKLSKTVKVAAAEQVVGLDGCTVTVEDEQSDAFPLHGAGSGKYTSPHVPIDTTKAYRLHIVTGDGKEYASDYVKVKPTPPIDSINFEAKQYNGDQSKSYVQLYVTSHDPNNNTRYYRWDFTETWETRALFESFYIVDNGRIRERTPDEQIFNCYQSAESVNIYLGSSEKLAQDVINQAPVAEIPNGTGKLKYVYSILLRQYAVSKDEYQFWENIQKNNEQLGSIFDAQPSQISGNIHNVKDANEPVIGYVSITNVQTKRIFINSGQVPNNDVAGYPFSGCKIDSALFNAPLAYGPPDCLYYCIIPDGAVVDSIINSGGKRVPTSPIPGIPVFNVAYLNGWKYSNVECVDCRLVGGTNKKPSFWIY